MKPVTIGITGPDGFIAEHLRIHLSSMGARIKTAGHVEFDDPLRLQDFVQECDCIFHLAGANRGDDEQVYSTNLDLTRRLIDAVCCTLVTPHIVFASSTLREADNAYGRSKQACEQLWRQWSAQHGGRVTVAVIPNVFGAGCRPFYNSVVATFCHQLACGETPTIQADRAVQFIWVNDLVRELAERIIASDGAGVPEKDGDGFQVEFVAPTAKMTVSELLQLLLEFRTAFFDTGIVPCLRDPLRASLYTTFLYYISLDHHQHEPKVHTDQRGHLYEIIKLADGGQVFFSSTKPGVIRGNHYHTRKVEWFCVLKGEALIQLRRVGTDELHEFRVSGDRPRFISIPVMHTHNIQNVGDDELLTMFWCNEIFDPENADTIFENVA